MCDTRNTNSLFNFIPHIILPTQPCNDDENDDDCILEWNGRTLFLLLLDIFIRIAYFFFLILFFHHLTDAVALFAQLLRVIHSYRNVYVISSIPFLNGCIMFLLSFSILIHVTTWNEWENTYSIMYNRRGLSLAMDGLGLDARKLNCRSEKLLLGW